MASKVDPTIAQMFAQNVRAQVIASSGASLKLDPQLVGKISSKVPIFAGMPSDSLMNMLASGETHLVKAGDKLFKQGDVGSAFYVLLAGEVTILKEKDGEMVELARLGPGECIGEMALVRNQLRNATVVANSDCNALRFEREALESLPQSAYFIYRNMSRILAARLEESNEMLANMVAQQKNSITLL